MRAVDAANTQRTVTYFNRVHKGHAGRHVDEVLGALHTHILDLAFGKGCDRGRDVLQ